MDHTRAAVRCYDLSFPYFALSIACSKYTTDPCRPRTLSISLSSVAVPRSIQNVRRGDGYHRD
jgi:hypothetical protein